MSEPVPGGKLEMFDGSIVGEYLEIVENESVKMKWKFKEWPEFADAHLTFVSFNDSCEVKVAYTNIPERDNHGTLIQIESI